MNTNPGGDGLDWAIAYASFTLTVSCAMTDVLVHTRTRAQLLKTILYRRDRKWPARGAI